MRYVAIGVVSLLACAHVPPPTVKASPGPVCQGGDYPADAPCLEKGEPAPWGGVLLSPELAHAWLAEDKKDDAENDSLKKSVLVDVGLIVLAASVAGVAGFELGRVLK